MQEKVFFEGLEGLEMVRPMTNTQLSYFPSYAMDEEIPKSVIKKPVNSINLIYFGRIGPMKNVDKIIDIFELLSQKRNDVYLTIIGGAGQSQKYVEMIDDKILKSPFKSHINRFGLSPFSFILNQMQSHHFFLFPTQEKYEGHSNSLTEAMSQGLYR